MSYRIEYNHKINLEIPIPLKEIEGFTKEECNDFFLKVEEISSQIRPKIEALDKEYIKLYEKLDNDNFESILKELNDISEKISLLNLWYYRMKGYFIQSD